MKLQGKLALYNTFSKVLMIVVASLIVPSLIDKIAMEHTDRRLKLKEEQALRIMNRIGIEKFIANDKDSSFASYNLLKEEFITLEPTGPETPRIVYYNAKRDIENQVVEYRILDYYFQHEGQHYLLEIGRSLGAIQERHAMLRSLAFILLVSIAVVTVFTDIFFARLILKPLKRIIDTKLRDVHHPATFNFTPISTSTDDFVYLDRSINEMMRLIQAAFEKEREFMSNVAHELLTPISILQNRFENILSEENLPEHLTLKLIESQKTLSRLKNVIKSLLLISQIENDQFLKTDKTDLEALVKEVAEEIEDRLEAKNISLKMDMVRPVPILEGNRPLLFTMFFNLINNAIKYNSENGSIFIQGLATEEGYRIDVQDTGTGIPAEALPELFNRFSRASNRENHDSYGLGLPIVQTIARFHDIQIKVNSEKGKGTTFSLLVPNPKAIS
ncbi:sensor histidine kinase [Adhaeribacter soli]|uniref:histidine kinase n=1 Tax=Adhaeribacter soli TaxID=2607655 RepID=A0A5N1ITW1_9BACT|nr:HAMP domain-containing sensor histidine kinase [Adhaeribacter soli]KAA9333524.1 HAMP domain-containing histidine kinase [Adhaeribacter soli]